jgi:hypothetical protein
MFRLRPSILFDYFRRPKKNVLDASKPRINIWTAGLNYEERKHNAKKCKLGEVVVFSREPNNAFDPMPSTLNARMATRLAMSIK